MLTVEPKEHFASVEAAREAVERFLTSWEIHVSLTMGRGEISFEYSDAEIIDRNPPPAGSPKTVELAASGEAVAEGSASLHVTRGKYPAPPKDFKTSLEVEFLLERYHRCLDGKERVIPLAYFCRTVLTSFADNQSEARKLFSISSRVFSKIGTLTAKGDLRTARKWEGKEQNRPLTGTEKTWLEQVVKRLILRLGEYNANPEGPFEKITMEEFPRV